MLFMEHLLTIVTSVTTLAGLITANLYIRKARRAEVRAKEAENKALDLQNESRQILNAEQMIELVKKANQEALDSQREIFRQKQEHDHTIQQTYITENRELKRIVKRLERAIKSVKSCDYASKCPVTKLLDEQQSVKQN